MPKTDKELAVELMGNYLQAIYSSKGIQPLDADATKEILNAFYDAVKSLPDE